MSFCDYLKDKATQTRLYAKRDGGTNLKIIIEGHDVAMATGGLLEHGNFVTDLLVEKGR
jgi:hypothetical protein